MYYHTFKKGTKPEKKKDTPKTFTDVTVLLLAWETGEVQVTQWSNLSLQKDQTLTVFDQCVNPSVLHQSLFPLHTKLILRTSNLS